MQQLAAYVSMRHNPTQRLVVEPHGGHYWSTQGTRHRPTNLFTLRIDDHERLTMHLADNIKSPSAYMLAHLRQRGWRLPPDSSVIPNVVPQAAQSSEARQPRSVWRLAFFGRLEERKGLKLFCEAVEMLDTSQLPKLEVIFIGGEAQVDMIPSVKYLKARTAIWPVPVTIYGALPRHAALDILRDAGVFIAFTSLVENLPFALAEACIEQIPFVTFNVGGVAELFDPTAHADVIVEHITAVALYERLSAVLNEGQLHTSVLHPSVRSSADLWTEFHVQLDRNRIKALKYPSGLANRHNRLVKTATSVDVIHLSVDHSSKDLKKHMCSGHNDAAFLLIPPEFSMPVPQLHNLSFVASQLRRLSKDRSLGAVVFGATLPNGMISYPTTPTWMVYHGSEPLCVENSPLLILAELFCTHFLAEAGDFTAYHTWVLIHHLRVAGLVTATLPDPVFVLNNFSRAGPGCFSDEFPEFRKLHGDYASNLMGPSEEVLITQHVASLPRPTASLRAGFDRYQGQHGWYYTAVDEHGMPFSCNCLSSDTLILIVYHCNIIMLLLDKIQNMTAGHEKALQWKTDDGLLTGTGRWTCNDSSSAFITRSTLHPCALENQQCCHSGIAAVGLRYVSNIWDMAALAEVTFEVWPTCGDGVTLQWILTNSDQSTSLFFRNFTVTPESRPHRETFEQSIALFPGDNLLFLVHPGANHDCDGVYVHDIKIWQSQSSNIDGVL